MINNINTPIFEIFPLLIPVNQDFTHFQGFVVVQSNQYEIEIIVNKNNFKKTKLNYGSSLRTLIEGFEALILQRLEKSEDLETFFLELKEILERTVRLKSIHAEPSVNFYSRLVSEIDTIEWKNLAWIDDSLTNVHINIQDKSERIHKIEIQLPSEYPSMPPQCKCDLPLPLTLNWTETSSLIDIQVQYKKAIDTYQILWDLLDDLDSKTWILEPEKPIPRAISVRRIALGNHCSLNVDIDLYHPSSVPECRFLGSDTIINPLREKLNKNLHKWDEKQTLFINLKNVLEIEFPDPKISKTEDFSTECGICYSYRLDSLIPDKVCDNEKCHQPFHQKCLYEWLHSIPSSRQSFNTLFGECPYCQDKLSVSF